MFLTTTKKNRVKSRSFEDTIKLLDGGYSTASGVSVSTESSLRQSTVWACVKIISEIIATLPIEIQLRQNGTWVTAEEHDFIQLINQPNDFQNKHDLISFLVSWMELDGNGYYYKLKNGAGKVRGMLPVRGDSVTPDIKEDWTVKYTLITENGALSGDEYGKDRVFHVKNFGTASYKGNSTIANHRNAIGLALQLEDHASAAYKNGLHSNKWIELETSIKEGPDLDKFRNRINSYKGAENTGEIPVLSKGKFHEFARMSAVDAQYIESRKMQKQEIASIFGVPLFLLNDTEKSTTWGSGLEQISRSFIRFSLNPRLSRLSNAFLADLVTEKQSARIVFDTDQFTLGEFKERMDGYKSGIEAGVLNSNECREIEGRNPREGGNEYRIPMNIGIEGESNDEASNETP
jgi:HK97 family phage portal protein